MNILHVAQGLLIACALVLMGLVVDLARRSVGSRRLMNRYQARAARSVPLATLFPDPWADRPYGFFRPEDVGA
jgi:hypothetical protein